MEEQESTVNLSAAGSSRLHAFWLCPLCNLSIPTTTAVCPQDGTAIDAQKEIDRALAETYEFIGTIGTGGMGVIYKARQKMLNKIVAIKMLHSHLLNIQSMLRFQQEAKAASALRHPNVIAVHDFGISEQWQPFMVMDYIEGITLSDLLRERGALPLPEAMDIFLAVCDALEHAHAHGVLHRDLKSSNIMLTEKDGGYDIHLLDFGIAKIVDDEAGGVAQQLTQTGEMIGSPLYMSPEQCMGKKVDHRSDIYSLGCILYEAVTGHPPHRGNTMLDTIFKHLNETPQALREARPDINFPETFDNLVMKLLATRPEDRLQNITQVKNELLNIQSGAIKGGFIRSGKVFWSKAKFTWPTIMLVTGIILAAAGVVCLLLVDGKLKYSQDLQRDSQAKLRQAEELSRQSADASTNKSTAKPKSAEDGTVTQKSLSMLPVFSPKIDISDKTLSENALQALLRFKNLQSLNLSNTAIKLDDLRIISRISTLRKLNLSGTKTPAIGLVELAALTNLQELYLDETEADDLSLQAFSRLPELKVLEVRDTAITDSGIKSLVSAKKLRTLSISGTNVGNAGLEAIGKMKLSKLNMWDIKATAGALESLGRCKNLETLCLKRVELNKKDLQTLSALPKLNYLELYNIEGLNDDTLAYFLPMKSLEELYFESCPLTDASAKYLAQMSNLEGVSLNNAKVSDKIIAPLSGLPKLEKLWLVNTQIRDLKDIDKLQKLEELHLSATNINDNTLLEIARLPHLTELEVWYCKKLTRQGIAAFKRLKRDCSVSCDYTN